MTTKAKSTKKTKLQSGLTTSAAGFNTIAEIKSFDGPNGTAPDIEVSNFDSDEAEFVPGLSVPGELQMNGNFVGDNLYQQQLDADRIAGTKRYYKLELNDHASDPSYMTFLASVTSFGISGGTPGVYEFKATLKISGTVTRHYTSGV